MQPSLHPAAFIAAIDTVLNSYKNFMAYSDEDDTKAFAARHAAGKVALQHLALLLSLVRTIKVEPAHQDELQDALAAAQGELNDLMAEQDGLPPEA